jgi:hypothetical protein
VRWWEWLLILGAANYPAMLVSSGQPPFSWKTYLAYGVTTTVGVFIISGIDRRRRRRADEETQRRESHVPESTCCPPRSRHV